MKFDFLYYFELQRRLIELNQFVSFHKDNFNTYSLKIENLFKDSCSFFDSLCYLFIKEKTLSKHKFHNEALIKHFEEKVMGDEEFTLENFKDLLEEDYALSVKSLNLNIYQEHFYKTYLTEEYYSPIERLGDKMKNEYKLQPFGNWRKNLELDWYQDYSKLKDTRLPNKNKATLINTLNAIAAIFILLSLKYRKEFVQGTISNEIYDAFTPLYGHHEEGKKNKMDASKILKASSLTVN